MHRLIVALAAAIASVLALASAAAADTFTVTRAGDPSPGACRAHDCSLREAVIAANDASGADKIRLPGAGPYRLTRGTTTEDAAADGDLDITSARITVVHPGSGRAVIDATQTDRHFDLVGGNLTLRKLVLRNGDADPSSESGDGGAVLANDGKLTVLDSVLTHNHSSEYGGGISAEGAASGVTVVRSRVVANRSADDSGAIDNDSSESLRVVRSVLANNSAGAGGNGGAMYLGMDRAKITKTTLAGNSSRDNGGALYISTDSGEVALSASTISGNRALEGADGGGIYVSSGDVTLVNDTIAGNRGEDGGGIFQDGGTVGLNAVSVVRNAASSTGAGGGLFLNTGDMDVKNSLLALNRLSGDGRDDCESAVEINSQGHNLVSRRTAGICAEFTAAGDLARKSPGIGKLAANGGPTKTVALKAGSPAIGKARKATSPKRDQRGHRRDAHPDIGAFER